MEIFRMEDDNKNKSFCCVNEKCCQSCIYKIDRANFELNGVCKMGHKNIITILTPPLLLGDINGKIDDIRHLHFNFKIIFKKNNTLNYYCNEDNNNIIEYKHNYCGKLFCYKWINIHSHSDKIKYINSNKLCKIHSVVNNFFCTLCKINICQQCKKDHYKHNIKSYSNIIYNNKKEKYNNLFNKSDYIKRENYLKNIKKDYDSIEVESRYKKIMTYFYFLENLSSCLNTISFDFFDYYNYENKKYFKKYIDNELNLENYKEYKDYLIYGRKLKNDLSYTSLKSTKGILITHVNFDSFYCSDLEYLKDNIFIKYDFKKIIFLEFKDFNFKRIFTYEGNFELWQYDKIWDNNKLYILGNGNIYIFEFDIINKKLKCIKSFDTLKYNIRNIIINKNVDIIIMDEINLLIFEEKNNYVGRPIKNYLNNFKFLYKVNNNLFVVVSKNKNNNSIIDFYDSNEYIFICSIKTKENVESFEKINNRLICARVNIGNNYLLIKYLLIDIINFEIINIFKTDFKNSLGLIKIKENYFLEYAYNHHVKIKYFNEKEAIFNELYASNIIIPHGDKIIKYKNDELIILGFNYLKLITV